MEENLWNFDFEKIEPQELNEKEKELAKECAEVQMEFEEVISMIDFNNEEGK